MPLIEPKIDEPDVGSPDDYAHYVRKEQYTRAVIEGGMVTALCGVQFLPLRDPERYPTCPRCKELIQQLRKLGSS